MANHDYIISNQTFPSTRTDINSVLQAIVSNNSSATEPATKYAYMMWYDTTTDSWKMRNADNDDWIQLATFDQATNTVNFLDSTISSPLSVTGTATAGAEIRLPEDTDNGSNYVALKAPDTLASDVTFTLPSAYGTTDQVLKTDGSGNLSFTDVSGGTDWQSSIVTASTLTAVSGNGYWIDTTSNACTITLPASASVGDTIVFVDYARTWATNAVTIDQNGLTYQGGTDNPVYDTDGQTVNIIYSGATNGWIPISDDDVADEGTIPPYNAEFLVIGGGGSGGSGGGRGGTGGGGAGGYRNSYSTESSGGGGSSETSLSFNSGTVYTITVGGGASSATTQGTASSISGTGITTITSTGGGRGAGGSTTPSSNVGGSGGGGNGDNNGGASSGTANQGYAGGTGTTGNGGGGGGGASAIGTNGVTNGGVGGNGLASSITGSSIARGGGGGSSGSGGSAGGAGGNGGGGAGAGGVEPMGTGTAGTINTGGGAGGSRTTGGAGGSGVVILRMLDADYSGTTTGSPTVATGVGGTDTVLTFNDSGTYTG